MTRIIEVNTEDSPQVKKFLDLPHLLYTGVNQWVPPIEMDARRRLDRKKNPFFQHSDAVFLLALDDKQRAVGRLAILENKRFNKFQSSNTAFLYLFECINNSSIGRQLFEKGCEWTARQGLTQIIGPKKFHRLRWHRTFVKGI